MNLKKSIQKAMAETGMRNNECAEALGMRATSFSKLKDRNSMNVKNLDKLAEVFGMSVSKFIALGEDGLALKSNNEHWLLMRSEETSKPMSVIVNELIEKERKREGRKK